MERVSAKQVIIEAFVGLAATKPVDKITVREVCRAAGVSSVTFYNHFTDKTDPYSSATQWPEGKHPVALNQIVDAFHGLAELLDAAGVENTLEVTEGGFHTFQAAPCPEKTRSQHNIAAFLMD